MTEPVLQGRSSSHFTRTARIFAHELEVPYRFRPVLDLMSQDAADYADNPALKVPIWIDEHGPLYGTENICRALARRAAKDAHVVLRGDVSTRVVANAEELTLHVMSAEVSLITAKLAGATPPPKVARGIENSLSYLDVNLEAVLAALPARRTLSFIEVSLFCVIQHLPFRQIMDVEPWQRLTSFARRFAERTSARSTEYRFDS